jgi:hypothetical protein
LLSRRLLFQSAPIDHPSEPARASRCAGVTADPRSAPRRRTALVPRRPRVRLSCSPMQYLSRRGGRKPPSGRGRRRRSRASTGAASVGADVGPRMPNEALSDAGAGGPVDDDQRRRGVLDVATPCRSNAASHARPAAATTTKRSSGPQPARGWAAISPTASARKELESSLATDAELAKKARTGGSVRSGPTS